jgi:hypothetical protein
MAVTHSYKELARILAKSVSNNADNTTLIEQMLLRESFQGFAQIAASQAATEYTLHYPTKAASRLIDFTVFGEATESKGANSVSYVLYYDDGAGGTPVTLTSGLVGTAVDITVEVANAGTVTAGIIIPAGSRLYVDTVEEGTGNAALTTAKFTCTIEYE